MKLSVLIPAHNEGGAIATTLLALHGALRGGDVPHELLVVADHCTDDTERVLEGLRAELPTLRVVQNSGPAGYGFAVRAGLESYAGDAVVIVMADASDDPRDVVTYYRKLQDGFDCVFGSRFSPGATVRNYPFGKRVLNRIANQLISLLFRLHYDDVTNAFKCFRREAIDGMRPLLACHFNLTVELPLKAVVRGYSWTVVPTNWYGRESGESKFLIQEMGSRYLFIVFYVLIEKYFSRGDYRRANPA
jgi:dolichol-phosphate mannosyltransferase